MTAPRAEALAARRATTNRRTDDEARREAHRALRAVRGADAARYSRTACSAAIRPRDEFATVESWRAFLEPLYPSWAVEIGALLYDSPTVVLLAPDVPPRARQRADSDVIDVAYHQAAGLVGPDGLWKIDPGEPLDDDEDAYLAGRAAVVARSRAARGGIRSRSWADA